MRRNTRINSKSAAAVVAAIALTVLAAPAQATLRIFACEPEWGALAAVIGGDKVSVYVATSAQQDPHHIDARPSLVAQVRKADLVVCTGAGLEVGWLPVLLARSANPALKNERLFFAAEKVPRLGVPAGPVDRSQGDVHPEGNPHVHLDPRRMITIGNALAAAFAAIDTANAAGYAANGRQFESAMSAAIAGWEKTAAALRGRNVIVYHDAWVYLNDWLGLKQVATLEPLPGIPPGGQHLATVAKIAQSQGVLAVLHTTYDDNKAVKWLAQHGGGCTIALPYTVGGDAQAKDLQSFYETLVNRIARGCR